MAGEKSEQGLASLLVVNAPNEPFSSLGILIEPIDALSLASVAGLWGAPAKLLDMDVERIAACDFKTHASRGFGQADVVAVVFDYHIPLHGDKALLAALEVAKQAREMGSKTVAIGKAATYKPGELLGPLGFDVLIMGEAEPALEKLLSLREWTDESLVEIPGMHFAGRHGIVEGLKKPGKAWDMSGMPMADRSLVDVSRYIDVRTILSSRGCHMKCSFCHVPGFWGAWRGRPAQSVVDEIESLAAMGERKILFLDDNAPVGKRRMGEICDGVIERGIEVSMGCLASVDCLDEPLLEKMRRAGFCWLHFGAESGDDGLLESISKRARTADIKRVVGMSKTMGFRVRTSWIMDLPGTDADQFARTADLIMELASDEVRLHHLALRLGSALVLEHDQVASTQYIHQGTQNQNLSLLSAADVSHGVEQVARNLELMGYACVRNPDEFIDMEALEARAPGLKVVSLCPLRYGLGWRRP